MYSKFVRAFYYFNIIVQSIVSLLCPVGLLTLLAWFLSDRAIVGKWIYAPLILLGFAVGLYSMFHFLALSTAQVRALEKAEEEKEKQKRIQEKKNFKEESK